MQAKGEGTPRGSGFWVLPFGARRTLSRPLKEKPQFLVRALVGPGARTDFMHFGQDSPAFSAQRTEAINLKARVID